MRDIDHEIARMEGEGPVPCPPERPTKKPADVTDRAVARFEDDGGPPVVEREELPKTPDIFGLQAEAMPLSPPERPMILADTVARIAFIRDDQPLKPIAMEVDFTGEDAIMAQAQLLPGRIEITLTNGFGRVRTLQLSPAEFMLVMMYGDRFFAELPR